MILGTAKIMLSCSSASCSFNYEKEIVLVMSIDIYTREGYQKSGNLTAVLRKI